MVRTGTPGQRLDDPVLVHIWDEDFLGAGIDGSLQRSGGILFVETPPGGVRHGALPGQDLCYRVWVHLVRQVCRVALDCRRAPRCAEKLFVLRIVHDQAAGRLLLLDLVGRAVVVSVGNGTEQRQQCCHHCRPFQGIGT